MLQEHGSSYVMDEEVMRTEKQKDNHAEHDTWEVLRSFHHNVSHLDEMIKKVNSIENNAVKNTDTINILNTLLQKSGLWGSNGWSENKAYFKRHEDHIVLVLNTVVDGQKLSSIGDIEKILTKVDEVLIKNPINPEASEEKKEPDSTEKIARANKRLDGYHRQIQEINSAYRDDTNDAFMAIDAVVDTFWGKSGKKTYEEAIRSTQKNVEGDYKNLIASFAWKEMSADDIQKLKIYHTRTEELLWKKLEDVQSFTGYLLKEKKMDSLVNGAHAIQGMAEWAAEAFIGTAMFLFLYGTNPDLRDAVHASIGTFYEYLKENYSDHERLWKDFLQMMDQELEKCRALPPEAQAEAIGKITGNIMATIIGAKGMSALTKSGKLRLKFKSPEIVPEPTRFRVMKSRSNPVIMPKKWPKAVTDIGEVKTWADLEGFISTVDRIRFKEWLTGEVVQEMINGARQGTVKISEIPNYGGIRKTVKKLIENGGIIPDPVDIRQKGIHAVEQTVKKGMKNAKEALPFKEAQKFLKQKMITGYDHIDVNITALRTLTNEKIWALGGKMAKISRIKEIKELTEKTIESMKTVSFPGKEELLNNLEKLRVSLISIKEKWSDIMETVDRAITSEWNLTKKEFQSLRFEEGFAVREIRKDGVTLYEYRGVDGKKLLDEYTYASHFKDGRASVTTKDGKNLTIDTTGKVLSEHTETFSSIQRFENGGYRTFEDGLYRIVYPEGSHKGSRTNYKSWKYTFMTEIQGDMVIGVDTRGVKYVIDQNKNRFRTPFHYVDDFTEHGVAAVQDKVDGRWLIVDKEGNLLRKDGSMIRGSGEIIDRDGNMHNRIGEKWGHDKPREQIAEEARESAFKEEWYDTNLEAIKAHMDTARTTWNPEVIQKIEADAVALLKNNGIDATNPMFSHTKKEWILLYEDSVGGTRIVNLKRGTVSKEAFSYIHTPDLERGFVRVSLLKDEECMGVIDLNGEYIVQPKYTSIQVHDDAKRLFEVSEMRKIGDTLDDGTVISEHFSDTPGSEMVERTGLIDGKGNILIETGYTEITKTNDMISQWLMRWEDYKILHKSKGYNTEEHSRYSTNVGAGNFDTASFMTMTATELSTGKKIGEKTVESFRSETSTVVPELKNGGLPQLIDGTGEASDQLSPPMQVFLQKKVPTIRDMWSLEAAVGQLVHNEVQEGVRKYLEKNRFSRLTKTERLEVAEYEKSIRERLLWALYMRVHMEQTVFRGNNTGREKFMDILANSLHPDLHKTVGWMMARTEAPKNTA